MHTLRVMCVFALIATPYTSIAQDQAPIPLPELPKLEIGKEASVNTPVTAPSTSVPSESIPMETSKSLDIPPLPPEITLPSAVPPLEQVKAQPEEKPLQDELSMPVIPGKSSADESFPVKPEAQKPTLELVDKIFGEKNQKNEVAEKAEEEKNPDVAKDNQSVTVATTENDGAIKKTKVKGKKNKKFGIRTTGGMMFGYKSQILPETIYMRQYPRGNRWLPKAQYEQAWDRLMFVTAIQNNINGLRSLIQTGRSPDMRDNMGQTPLTAAVRYNAINTTRLLLASGANPNVMDNAGNTPLHYAIANNNYQAVMALLEMGGKPDLADGRGVTAFMMAERTQNPLIRSAMGL